MRKLIQIVGVPGSGKSHLFRNIQVEGITYVEFGTEFKKWIADINGFDKTTTVPQAPKEYVKIFLDRIIDRQPAMFTSHITYFNGKEYVYNEELEMYVESSGYIFVYSNPSEIAKRRQKDNEFGTKLRDIESSESIERHQQVSLELVESASSKIGSRVLKIQNTTDKEQENLASIKRFTREVLL